MKIQNPLNTKSCVSFVGWYNIVLECDKPRISILTHSFHHLETWESDTVKVVISAVNQFLAKSLVFLFAILDFCSIDGLMQSICLCVFIFAVARFSAKIKTHKYILYMSPSMEQKSKIANKKQANLL